MASPFASMIPGFGPLATTALDAVQHGIPTNFGQLAQMGLRQVPNLIPGGGMLSQMMPGGLPGMLSHMMPGGGGGGAPQGFPGFPGFPPGFRFQ